MALPELDYLQSDRLFINGEAVPPSEGRTVPVLDPTTGEAYAEVADGSPEDIDRAVAAAATALADPSWRAITPTERGGLMYRLADLMRRDAERLALLESFDNGQTIRDTTADVGSTANWLTYYAGLADKLEGASVPVRSDWHAYTIRQPVGVVGAIVPWNGPLLMAGWKLGPALAAGCTVVLKPAEQTSLTALALAGLIAEAGFPPGVVNVVPGVGEVVGRRLVEHPDVNKIAFTGSHETAQEIIRLAAGTLKRVSAECGGKAPQIIFPDADLNRAMDNAAFAAFRRTGQSCTQGSRVLVHRDVYDEVVKGVADRANRVRVGDPRDERTFMGPHTFAEKLENTLDYIRVGNDEGARLVVDGTDPKDGQNGGYWIRPTVFADVTNTMRIAQEEIFGPVLAMLPFDDEDEAVAIANDVMYGLTAGVWTNDLARAHRMIARIEAGTVSVNAYPAVHWMLPYGGFKMSGFGRENGLEAIDLYTETKTAVIDIGSQTPAPVFGD
jgi:(Z)-2-((N-methylformamido)methylene)-5-hydroxybutyrolactone dehydrogenase